MQFGGICTHRHTHTHTHTMLLGSPHSLPAPSSTPLSFPGCRGLAFSRSRFVSGCQDASFLEQSIALRTGTQCYDHRLPNFQTACSSLAQLAQVHSDEVSNLEKEPHKFFDQVIIVVRSGDGGHGAILSLPRPTVPGKTPRKREEKGKEKERRNRKLKRGSDGSLILPMGGHGGDVIIYADESKDTLLEFHKKKRYNAKRGANVDAMGRLTPFIFDGSSATTLRIPVPVGTVVKKKRGGKLLADLSHPGDELLVARGGRGGISMMDIPKNNRSHLHPVNAPVMKDPDDKALVLGAPGEEIALELILRVVADVGLVGLPNAGKSSLLAAVTRAKPEIAEYPFTTLIPNLGRLDGDPEREDGGLSLGPTMADLPGLIKGAHLGKGLGRMFLRHLRRTRLMVHVVDASASNPVHDYIVLRQELLMYNPEYLLRPHIIVLNKLDIPEAKEKFEAIKQHVLQIGNNVEKISSTSVSGALSENESEIGADRNLDQPRNMISEDQNRSGKITENNVDEKDLSSFPRAVAVVGISALQGFGVEDLLKTIRSELYKVDSLPQKDNKMILQSRPEVYKPPQWYV